jgi:phosphatidylglycerophosphate synthase
MWAPSAVIGVSLLVLVGDGLDGWLARRYETETSFGAFFDKETDALFLLLLCAIAGFRGRLPIWILGAGLLRYVFVGLIFLIDPPEKTEERSTVARYVYAGMVGALLLAFLPYPGVYRPVAGGATAALAVSFVRSLWGIVSQRRAFGEP